jgi:hypothetical protein
VLFRSKDAKEAAERQKKREEQARKDAEKLQHEKEKLAEEAAKKEAERLKKIKEDQKALTEFLKSEQEKRYQDTLANDDKLVRQAQVNYEEKKKLAHGNAELLKQLEEEYQKQIAEIRDKETLKIQGRDATRVTSSTTANGIVLQNNQKEVEQAIANQKRIEEGEQALQASKLRIAQETIGGLMDLNSAFVDFGLINAKKGFQISKTLGIAQATIATIEGAQNAFTTALGSPITEVFPAYPFIQAGIATAAGLARVASIKAQQFNGGGGSQPNTSMGGGGGSVSTPSAPAVDLSYLNKGSNKAQPVQAYVLATNVSSAQEAEQKIKDQSKIIK